MRLQHLAVVCVAFVLGLVATIGSDEARAAPLSVAAAPSYKGTWFGTTGQERDVDFTVNRRNRLTLPRFSFEIEGDGCSVEIEKAIRGTVAVIRKKAFKVTRETSQDSFTLTGRFSSKTAARGKLTGSFTGSCPGTVETTWSARKGKRPPVDRAYDGTWEGEVAVPQGVDPIFQSILDWRITFEIEDGAVTSVAVPWLVVGAGCTAALAGRIEEAFTPPIRLDGARFSVARDDHSDFAVDGTFASPTSAGGTLAMSGTSSAVGGPSCSGAATTTWSAAKQ